MNHQRNKLLLRRGRLLERIATQRAALARDTQPVSVALSSADRMLDRVRSITDYIKRHPSLATLAVTVLFLMKSRRIWQWTKRSFVAWKTWRGLRDRFLSFEPAHSRARS